LRLLAFLLAVPAIAYVASSAYLATVVTTAGRHHVAGTPADLGLAYEPVMFASAEDHLALQGWLLPAPTDRAIVMVHGLDGNRWSGNDPEVAKLFVERGFNVLVFDLRAHGDSGGEHFGLGWYERRDVRAAVDLLERRGIPPGRIGLYGVSLGAATSLLAAAAIPEVGAVVEDSGFADARDLFDKEINAKTGLPPVFTPGITFFGRAFYGLDLDAIPPVRAVPAIAPRPILFIHGDADTRIPVDNARRLKAASANPADELWIVSGVGHGGAFGQDEALYAGKVIGFYEQNLK
jgi:pimeloyl-ACP methyl ester carboxylesterase